MRGLRSILGNRNVLALLVLVLAVGVFFATMPSSDAIIVAGPGVTTYYSNGSYTTVVGARGTGCCGSVINWGITTRWKKFQKIYCPDVVCPN